MVMFSTLRKRVSAYFSPVPIDRDDSQHTSSSISAPPNCSSSPLEHRLDRRSMTPNTRTNYWLWRKTPQSESTESTASSAHTGTPSVLGVKGSKVQKRNSNKLSRPATSEALIGDKSVAIGKVKVLSKVIRQDEEHGGVSVRQSRDDDGEDVKEEEEEVYAMEDIEGSTLLNDEDESEEDAEYEPGEGEGDSTSDDSDSLGLTDELANDTTLIGDEVEGKDVKEDNDGEWDYEEDEEGETDEANQQAQPDPIQRILDKATERLKREHITVEAAHGEWSGADVVLFQKLSMRGFEPLLPNHWRIDFPTLPETMFTKNDKQVFINSVCDRDFRATRALNCLFGLGARVRDRLICSQPPEAALEREIEAYICWAYNDAGVPYSPPHRRRHKAHDDAAERDGGYIPILAMAAARPHQSTKTLIRNLTRTLHASARRYQARWRIAPSVEAPSAEPQYAHPLPTLYGLVLQHTVVAVISLDAATLADGKDPEAKARVPVRTVATFDFGKGDYDVWNAFAVAIVVVTVRDRLLRIRRLEDERALAEGRAPNGWGRAERDASSDPDA